MKRELLIVLILHSTLGGSAQVELPVFGKQNVINGYAKDIEGEVLSYFSVYPEHATTALLTRCTDGKKAITWETAAVPHYTQDENIPYYYFSWIAAHNSTTSGGDRSFDLFIGEEKVLTFTTHHSPKPATWSVDGTDGASLVFEYSKMDRHGDAHGFAHLRVPLKYIKPGRPLQLKVVGHAQDSPDWFMTFRYTFEEKVEVEALPFLTKSSPPRRAIQITVMHFGAPTKLKYYVGKDLSTNEFPIHHGLQVIEGSLPIPKASQEDHDYTESVGISGFIKGGLEFDTLVRLSPIVHRDIHLIHHSHTDIGYSHLQSEVETIQNNNIFKALELIDRTKDYPTDSRFVWNVESLWAVENFLGIANETDKQRFVAAVKSGSIALSANYANILTGLCTPEEMHWIVEYADSLRARYGLPITSAMQTDIPGMSWSMVDAYAAHGIRYLSQGPNYIPDMPDGGDRIGSTLREQGDKPYWWKSTTGKDSILVWTAGQGYGGWHGYTAGDIKERGTRKIAAYMNDLAAKGYPYDMVQWRYNIVSDNGPVDSTLSDFVREWNEKYSSPRLIISNVGDMMAEFDKTYGQQIPTWSGDFTPYWEDGAYSTAKEEGDVRMLSARLSNLIDAARILGKPIDPHLLYRAKRSIVMWHEHTWGAWCSISDPDAHFTTDQWRVKKAFADSAGWYVKELATELLERPSKFSQMVPFSSISGEMSGPRLNLFWDKILGRASPLRSSAELLTDSVQAVYSWLPPATIWGYDLSPIDSVYEANWDCVESIPTMSWLLHRVAHGSIRGNRMDDAIALGHDFAHFRFDLIKQSNRDKASLHLALPFNIPNATVRIGISDTCVTPESGRIPGSNNDFFSVQRWIDVSNDSMGVTIVCPQGALWEVGEMVDERKVNPGAGTNPELYKAWKTEAHSSSTIYLYALNNYWHTNFKADQEGPITFDIYLKMHGPFKLEDARRFGLEMTRPLITWWK